MTPRQRVLAAMRRTALPDRCPFEISWGAFTPGLMKVYRDRTGSALEPCEHFDFDTRSVDLAPTRKQTDFRRFYQEPVPDHVVFDEWGVGMVPGPLEHFVEFKYHPLASCETPDQVLEFDWPDVDADYRFEPLAAKVADCQGRGYAAIGRQYGDRLSFWGGIGTQSTMPFGTPGDVERKVREVHAALGPRGGLLLAPTHILEPEVPWENIEAFVAAAMSAQYAPAATSDRSNQSNQP